LSDASARDPRQCFIDALITDFEKVTLEDDLDIATQ
jgi:hypothetical protein